MTTGRNTPSGEMLSSLIERIERIREDKKALAADEQQVFAEAKAAGFAPRIMRRVLKIRQMKPSDVQEMDAETDIYLHALGMASDTPLFRAMGLMEVDIQARDSITEAMKKFVPQNGEIIIKMPEASVRVWRDQDGETHAEDYRPPEVHAAPERPTSGGPAPRAKKEPPPPCTDDEARDLGRTAAKNDEPVISNPFPYGDRRRPLWDEGWRAGAGTDGMGPAQKPTKPKPKRQPEPEPEHEDEDA